jgi:hypothetical protein
VPFTLSHIAAALPGYRALSRLHLFTPAVIGTMVPDFHVLLPNAPDRLQTHSYWPGLLSFSLPVGLTCYALTLWLIKPAILEVVPDGPYARLHEAEDSGVPHGPSRWILAALAILAGAVTHLIWDGFTHESAPGVRMFPVLDDFGPHINGHSLQLYRWLQYGSSVLGLSAVLICLGIWLWYATPPRRHIPRRLGAVERRCWLSFYVLIPLIAAGLELWKVQFSARALATLGNKLELIAVAGMRASVLTLLLLSLIMRARLMAR